MIKGVDISHWNGTVDFERLKEDGYDFAIIKATQGTWFVDDKLLRNVAACGDAGMAHSLYHFLDPIMDGYQDGNEQYEYFMDNTSGLHGTLPNALDVEWQGSLSKFGLTELVLDFLIQPGEWLIYSNLNFFNNILLQPDDIADHADIWLAWPSATAMKPRMPLHYSASEVKLWQWDWTGGLDKNRVLDEAWYESYVKPEPPQHIVRVIAPKGVEVDVTYTG
jgi:GH25 family lysozyme M1 (1,4-beta-N-acetylmuramidase)